MSTLYPTDLDKFREHVAGFDYLHAGDLTELLGAASVIQSEMGLEPSGSHGTVSSRLFENGNLSQKVAAWQRLIWDGAQAVADSEIFSHSIPIGGGFRIDYDHNKFRGAHSEFGEDTPTPFGVLQGPVTTGLGAQSRGGVPWRSMISRIFSSSDSENSFCEWIARDGQNSNLLTSNSVPCRWGYMIWNLVT